MSNNNHPIITTDMKKYYESPFIVVREVESDNVMDDNVISDGGGEWSQDIDPGSDPGTGEPIRIPSYNPWGAE